jgi:hypothetical protein
VRQELESLLDDDADMADLYLTRRAQAWERQRNSLEARRHSMAERGELGGVPPMATSSHLLLLLRLYTGAQVDLLRFARLQNCRRG